MPGIFISYRRSDSPDATGRIYDRLVAEFGKAQVFKDVDSIPLGRDFRGHLNDIVGNCGVMLAIVGPRWMEAQGKAGQRRLDDADDFVRIELEAALARDIPVVPVLVAHAPIPSASELPASLASMAFRQSIEVRPDPDFHNDATRLVMALQEILGPDAPRPVPPSLTKAAGRSRMWMGAFAAAVLVAAALAFPALKYLNQTPPPETRLDIVTPTTDQPAMFALSPDGRQIVFVASGDGALRLWLRSLATTTAQPLAGTEGASYPFWSPDGRSVGFFAGGALKRLDLGGAPQTLAPVLRGIGGTWNAEGVIVFASSVGRPLMRVSAGGGAVTDATTLGPQHFGHIEPSFLPDGRRILFTTRGGPDVQGIYLGSLDGSAAIRLVPGLSQARYLPAGPGAASGRDGWLLWGRDNTLVAQRLDLDRQALVGEAVTLADGIGNQIGNVISGWSVAAPGLVAYRAGAGSRSQLTWVDPSGTARGTLSDPESRLANPSVSPDGRRVVTSRPVQGNTDLWILDGARMSRLTFDAAEDSFPLWSPDGTRIIFRSQRTGVANLYQTLTNGTGGEERLVSSDQIMLPNSWSPDGRFMMYTSVDPQTKEDLWVVPMTGDRAPSVFLKTPFLEVFGKFSPDGRWVAYMSNESGQMEIYVRPFVAPGAPGTPSAATVGQRQVSTAGGIMPVWRPDGRALYYLNPAGEMMAAPIAAVGNMLEPGAPVVLFPTRIVRGGVFVQQQQEYDVAPDGRFLINMELAGAAAPITLIQNWNPEAQTN